MTTLSLGRSLNLFSVEVITSQLFRACVMQCPELPVAGGSTGSTSVRSMFALPLRGFGARPT